MVQQLEFPSKPEVPEVKAHEVRAVVTVLRRERRWMKAHKIAAALGKPTAAFERKVRKIASVAAPTVVSYPGSPGYRFWNECSAEEIDRCIASLEAQGRDMIKRANVYRLAYYRMHREPVETAADQERLALSV